MEFERPRTEKDHNWFLGTDRKVAEDGWNERLQKDVKSAQEAGRMPLLAVWKETISLRDGYKWSGPAPASRSGARRTTSRAGRPCTS